MHTQDTIRTLNRLIRICRDGERFCRVGMNAAESSGLRTLLQYRSEEWGRHGDELQALVLLLKGEPATSGTPAAGLTCAWTALRAAMLGANDLAVVERWQRLQQRAFDRYEEALSGYLPERIRRTVQLQAERVFERCEQIGALRGQCAIHSHGA